MRPGRILAIAHRDLRGEFAGKRFGLLGIIALLLAPAIALEAPERGPANVSGAVPEAVLAAPDVRPVKRGGVQFQQDGDVVRVYTFSMPKTVREALDAGNPTVGVEVVQPPTRWPKRSLFFALIAASTLTGSVATSIGGERTRHTLQALLSAAVTRFEIVAGKWLAWSGFGTLVALAAAAGAVFWGKQDAGPWIAALPFVPAVTVALGLYLVRRTDDVVAGTSVSLRVLPAVLGGATVLSLALATRSDVLAAALPLGGVMLATGDLWNSSVPLTALACVSSGLTTGFLLWATARDLEEEGSARREEPRWLAPIRDGLGTTLTWWTVLAGAVLWGWAGNTAATAALPAEDGLWAGTALLLVLTLVAGARRSPTELGRVRWTALVGGVLFAGATFLPSPHFANPWLTESARRLHLGHDLGFDMLPLLILQEIWFRGFLQKGGWVLGALIWTLVVAPLDPLVGLGTGLALAWCSRYGIVNAIAARLVGVALLYAWSTTMP